MTNFESGWKEVLRTAGKSENERLAEAQDRVRQVEENTVIGPGKALGRAIMRFVSLGDYDTDR